MKKALIIGASGLIGSNLTNLLINDTRYSEVNILVRTPIDIRHSKLYQHKFDFNWPEKSLIKADELYCCLGTTIKKAGSLRQNLTP